MVCGMSGGLLCQRYWEGDFYFYGIGRGIVIYTVLGGGLLFIRYWVGDGHIYIYGFE